MYQATLMDSNKQTMPLDELASIFKALSDPARLKIVQHLAKEDHCCNTREAVCACDLEFVTSLTQPTVSHHMKTLVLANLVSAQKKGKWMYYALKPEGFKLISKMVVDLTHLEQ